MLPSPGNGSISNGGVGVTLKMLTYSCNAGYTLTGTASTVCSTLGVWSGVPPTCVRKYNNLFFESGSFCLSLSLYISLCLFVSLSLLIEISRIYAPFRVIRALTYIAARACSTLTTPVNGAALFGLTGVTGDVLSFACNTGYTLTGSASLTCLTTGAWSAATPTCPGAANIQRF